MNIFKLSNRKVVVSENGISKVLTAPCGVSYSEAAERWMTWVLDETGDWKSRSFSVKAHGPVTAFELAVEAREESLSFLLNRRMLPRIRHLMRAEPDHSTTVRQVGDFFIVRDPLEKKHHKFATVEDAKKFNVAVTEEWKLAYKFDKLSMIRIEQGSTRPRSYDAFTRQFQAEAARMGL